MPNGDKPPVPRPSRPQLISPPRVRVGASDREIAQAFASVVAGYEQHLRAIYAELDEMRATVVAEFGKTGRAYEALRDKIDRIVEHVIRAEGMAREVQDSIPEFVAEATGNLRRIDSERVKEISTGVTTRIITERDLAEARAQLSTAWKLAFALLSCALTVVSGALIYLLTHRG